MEMKEENGKRLGKERRKGGGKWKVRRIERKWEKRYERRRVGKRKREANTLNNDMIIMSYSLPDCTSEVLHKSL